MSMKFLVFSDSHGKTGGMEEAIRRNPDADAVFFLGDRTRDIAELRERSPMPWLAVAGNCDGLFPGGEDELTLIFEGRKILLTHGHRYGVKGGTGALLAHGVAHSYDIILYGHTHEAHASFHRVGEKEIYLCNPGSIGQPRGGAPTFGLLLLDQNNVLFSLGTVEN